jgi:adenine-specific DNA glycosylase
VSQSDAPEPVGSVAEEAAKLLGAVSGWAREQRDGVADLADAMTDEAHEHLAPGSPECTWCPVCRTIAAVRQTSPEVRAHLASAASSLMLAVSEFLATRPPARESKVEHIDLDDTQGDWSGEE